jgi:threonine dehydratase
MAVAYAATALKTTAKVVMPKSANPYRVQRSRELGAEVELVDDVHQAFARVKAIEASEGRTLVHPFEGPKTALGTATPGLEIVEQVPDLDAVIVPVDDDAMRAAMLLLFRSAKLAVEPAGAAATAALCGPLRDRLRGRTVVPIVCGANIDPATFPAHLAASCQVTV